MIAVVTPACADGNADTSAVEEVALEAWPGMELVWPCGSLAGKRVIEASYIELGLKKEIPGFSGKTVASAWVVHRGSRGLLILEFTDGTVKVYGYKDLGFWEEDG